MNGDELRVLLVDDEVVVLEAFVDILEDDGYKIFTAENGILAMKVMETEAIDIVVTDIKMPGMDGFELLAKIREKDKNIPVIMATAFATIEHTVEAMRRGASNYLIKPIQVDLLRAVLVEGAHKRNMLRENAGMLEDIRKQNEELSRLDAERTHVLEIIAQKLRQPLIDQMNWCELLLTDEQKSPSGPQLERITKIRGAGEQMLQQVVELLDSDSLKKSAGAAPAQEVETPAQEVETLSSNALPGAIALPVPGNPERGHLKILLADSDEMSRDLLYSALSHHYRVFPCADGMEALREMVERPHLIVADLDLARVDGEGLIVHARRIDSSISFIATSESASRLEAFANKHHPQQKLVKPFNLGLLQAGIQKLTENLKPAKPTSLLVYSPDELARFSLGRMLDSRYHVSVAQTPEQAIAMLGEHPEIILLDICGEDRGWLELAAAARSGEKKMALIDNPSVEILKELKGGGIGFGIKKPYRYRELLKQLRGLCGVSEIDALLKSVFVQLG
ncbi:MAG: response regulator [Planctomycetes bacterium]|nr:response regulator [Planctomycetota bacterium]